MTHDTQRLKAALEALDAHDRETRSLHEAVFLTQKYPPLETWGERERKRALLSIKLEEEARALLAESFGVEVMP